ncbi:toll/interleukin-1 receptor domain-containing protein [Saccharothrix variisporea]|uniref:SEFIR domain-containing protein n=1 Tax=Saccharothrix variisporea TaxID=543527 RepID=A0A495XL83_9PSEU|nr:toll/interleukin-1 receptor domain-containing protein [Saccharothrix variisporea]RKT74409.1 SEFIR domain-containing protein [Saccharothrix variisporea]
MNAEETLSPTAFISYVHGSARHKQLVLDFARLLQDHGVSTTLDRWTTGRRKDWYQWIVAEMTRADFILPIASKPYKAVFDGFAAGDKHRGTQAEAAVLRELLYSDRPRWLPKILPVVLPGRSASEIPLVLQPNTVDHYPVPELTSAGAEDLLRALTGQPKHMPPSLGTLPVLPPLTS